MGGIEAGGFRVRRLGAAEARAAVPELAEVLIDCVAGGASVSFMAPLDRGKAVGFWQGVADGVARGERVLLVAETDGAGPEPERGIVGTVQVILAQPENQPHRGDVSKLLVHRRARGTGVGAALMAAAEDAACDEGKTLLVLDTASDGAERLYRRQGWVMVGTVPGYALWPDGEPCDTVFYYKRVGAGVRSL
ncbi:N-acetyltransferase [Skermanella aerolata]|uniref:N-acetyltransferase n=1 Tax=Skermanella aerolata TaxID=393310 RepID=A0A512E0U7_9PROT|nr:GNAT family N-acetyltransferase [Skermanella aerolata]KJB91612.1 N-acetyltransferase [Skermanella aerolata KACC 11604]GEO42353.1 N-acetyltransferase [Skermanella aerolata]